jgi:hypothetical protein
MQIDMIIPQDLNPMSSGVVEFQKEVYPCPEVQISFELIKIVFIEVIKEIIYHPLIYALNLLRSCFCP